MELFQLEMCEVMESCGRMGSDNRQMYICNSHQYAGESGWSGPLSCYSSKTARSHPKDIQQTQLTLITHVHAPKHTYSLSITVHCAFSPELSQHYRSWCCVSEMIAGSNAVTAGTGFSLKMLTGHFGMTLLPCEVLHRWKNSPSGHNIWLTTAQRRQVWPYCTWHIE